MTLKKNEYFIDISSYQESDAKVYGVSKTIIKATEGTSYISPKKNYQANSSDPQGYYHFARFGGSVQQAQAEASFFVNNLPPKKVKYLVLDWEDSAGSNKQANTDAVIAFMSFVKAKGYEPIFYGYVYYSADTVYLDQICAKFPKCLWLAGYAFGYNQRADYTQADQNQMQINMSSKGILGLWEHVRWIQFTSTGITPTYAGSLDKNVVLISDDVVTEVLKGVANMQDYVLSCSKHGGGVILSGKLIGVTNPGTMSAFEHGGAKNIGSIDSKDWEIIQNSLNKTNHCGGTQDYVLSCSKHGGGLILSGKLIGVTKPGTMSAFEHGGAKNIGSIDSRDWETIEKNLNK